MKNLWTPWRMEHVTGETESFTGCLFEPHFTGIYDKTKLVLFRDTSAIVLLNRFPYSNGHLLVAPRSHVGCLTELTTEASNSLTEIVKESTRILRKHLNPDGFNIGLNIGAPAGAGIADHIHFHIVPRWSGDHNFMTVISEIRTIPEHIDRTFDRLLPDFKDLYLGLHS